MIDFLVSTQNMMKLVEILNIIFILNFTHRSVTRIGRFTHHQRISFVLKIFEAKLCILD
jgi:hypothetical protein